MWLLVLLPAAAASGWFAAGRPTLPGSTRGPLPNAYYRGLNLLLNDEPGEAIEAFAQLLETESEAVEIQLALGNLFRRRGELERATRMHRGLLKRQDLSTEQRHEALFELGQDYFKAGLFDRAEETYRELTSAGRASERAYANLLRVYDLEKEWGSAIAAARSLEQVAGRNMSSVVAQYYCELAESGITTGRYEDASRYLELAAGSDPNCVRATIQQGRLAALRGDHQSAIGFFTRVGQQDSRYLGEVVDLAANSFRMANDEPGFKTYVRRLMETHLDAGLRLVLDGSDSAPDLCALFDVDLVERTRSAPSLFRLYCVIRFRLRDAAGVDRENLLLLAEIVRVLLNRRPRYLCEQCGFTGQSLQWQCPSCHSWTTMAPAPLAMATAAPD